MLAESAGTLRDSEALFLTEQSSRAVLAIFADAQRYFLRVLLEIHRAEQTKVVRLPGWILRQANQVRENAIGARNSFRQLAIKSIGVVNVNPFSILRIEQAALLWCLAWVMGRKKRFVVRIPGLHPFRASLLRPAAKITFGDCVRPTEDRICGRQYIDLRSLIRHFFGIVAHHVRIWAVIVIVLRRVVLDDNYAAISYVFQQTMIVSSYVIPYSVRANSEKNHIILTKVTGRDIRRRQKTYFDS